MSGMTGRRLPNCCGSEDGQLVYGIDPARTGDTMVEAWACSTCGVVTVTAVVRVALETVPPT